MKPQKLIFKALFFSFLFSACDKARESKESTADISPPPLMETVKFSPPSVNDEETASGSAEMSFSTTETVSKNAAPVEKSGAKMEEKIKKTADLNITVDDYKVARSAIEKIVRSGHAYIAGENEQNNTYSISNTMVIRVANKYFDGTVNNVAAIPGHVNSKNIYMEDVTAQFVDITARLKSKKEVEKRYLEILQKANKVSDILEVEGQLRVIREEIEAKEGELKYLNDQVDYSTINLTIHQDFEYTPQDRPGFFGRMGTAFGNGWNGFLSFLVGIMYVYAWPLWILLSIGGYFLYRFIKRQTKKK
jgi:hypothetical protein